MSKGEGNIRGSIMFNAMITHGFNPEDLLLSTIISIPKDNRGSMNSSDNYRGEVEEQDIKAHVLLAVLGCSWFMKDTMG